MGPAATFSIVVVVLAVSVVGGWYVTRGVLRLASRPVRGEPARPAEAAADPDGAGATLGASAAAVAHPEQAQRPAEPQGPTSAKAVAALRGGTWIGILERLAITGLVLVGYPTGIAILVAVKGLGRYPELKDNPEASERFVIGTLVSMVWSGGLGLLGLWLLTLG